MWGLPSENDFIVADFEAGELARGGVVSLPSIDVFREGLDEALLVEDSAVGHFRGSLARRQVMHW